MRNEKLGKNLSGFFLKIFQKIFMKILKISKKIFFSKIFETILIWKKILQGPQICKNFRFLTTLDRLMVENVREKRLLDDKHAQTCPGVR